MGENWETKKSIKVVNEVVKNNFYKKISSEIETASLDTSFVKQVYVETENSKISKAFFIKPAFSLLLKGNTKVFEKENPSHSNHNANSN